MSAPDRRGAWRHPVPKPAGVTSHDVVAAGAARRSREGTKVGHAGTLDPFATGLLLVLVGPRHPRAAVPDGAAEDLPGGGAAGLDAPTPATATALLEQTGPRARGSPRSPPARYMQRPPAYSAVKVGRRARSTRRRAGARRRRARRGRSPCTAPSCSSTTARRPRSRSSARRAPTCASWWPALGDAYCERAAPHRDRPVRGWRTPTPSGGAGRRRRWHSCRSARSATTRPARVAHGVRVRPGDAPTGPRAADPRRRADRHRRAAGRRAAARRSVRRVKVTQPPRRPGRPRASAAAQGGDRHLRRRARGPPRGDPRQRHRAHLRPAPAVGRASPEAHAEAGDAVLDQAGPDRAGWAWRSWW